MIHELLENIKNKVDDGTKVKITIGRFSTDNLYGSFEIDQTKLESLRQALLKDFINRYTKDQFSLYRYRDKILEIREDKSDLYFEKNKFVHLTSNFLIETLDSEKIIDLERFPNRNNYHVNVSMNVKRFNYHSVDVLLTDELSSNKKISYVTVVFEKNQELPRELIKALNVISSTVF